MKGRICIPLHFSFFRLNTTPLPPSIPVASVKLSNINLCCLPLCSSSINVA